MVVIWDKNAKNDLKNYIKHSNISSDNLKNYIKQLVIYTKALADYPNMGKIQYIYNNSEIRQLVYKMHKIFYYIKGNKVIIVAVFHTAIDIEKITKYLRGLSY